MRMEGAWFSETLVSYHVTICTIRIKRPHLNLFVSYSCQLDKILTSFVLFLAMKLKLSLSLTKHHAMKGSGGIAPRILDLGTERSEWFPPRPGHFISG